MFLTSILVTALFASGHALAEPTVEEATAKFQARNKNFNGIARMFPAMTLSNVAVEEKKANIRGGVVAANEADKMNGPHYEEHATITWYSDDKCKEMIQSVSVVTNTCIDAVSTDNPDQTYSYKFDYVKMVETFYAGPLCGGRAVERADIGRMIGITGHGKCEKDTAYPGNHWVSMDMVDDKMREKAGGYMFGDYAARGNGKEVMCEDNELVASYYFHHGACNDLTKAQDGFAYEIRSERCRDGMAHMKVFNRCGGKEIGEGPIPGETCSSNYGDDDDDSALQMKISKGEGRCIMPQ